MAVLAELRQPTVIGHLAGMRSQRHALETGNDVDVEVEDDLSAGALVELLHGDAVCAQRRDAGAGVVCSRAPSNRRERLRRASSRLRHGVLGTTSMWPSPRGMMSMKASVSASLVDRLRGHLAAQGLCEDVVRS